MYCIYKNSINKVYNVIKKSNDPKYGESIVDLTGDNMFLVRVPNRLLFDTHEEALDHLKKWTTYKKNDRVWIIANDEILHVKIKEVVKSQFGDSYIVALAHDETMSCEINDLFKNKIDAWYKLKIITLLLMKMKKTLTMEDVMKISHIDEQIISGYDTTIGNLYNEYAQPRYNI